MEVKGFLRISLEELIFKIDFLFHCLYWDLFIFNGILGIFIESKGVYVFLLLLMDDGITIPPIECMPFGRN